MDSYDIQGSARTKSASQTTTSIGRIELRKEKARALARPDPATVTPQMALREALAQMREHGGDAILVKENGRIAGILTERDVLTRVFGAEVDEARPVSEFMTSDPHTLSADASLLEAMQAMESGHYRNVPLVEQELKLQWFEQQDWSAMHDCHDVAHTHISVRPASTALPEAQSRDGSRSHAI